MTVHSLYPGFIKLDYHSAYGKHSQILPTRAWSNTNITGVLGSYTSWSGAPIDAEAMVDAFVADLKGFYLATTTIDACTLYSMATPSDPAIPVAGKGIGVVGTNTGTTQAKATIQTWVMRDTAFDISKLVFLDAPVAAGFEPVTALSGAPAGLLADWTSNTNAWSSRAGNRVVTFFKATYDLDDKLRREYGMV
jgi:hypothetical protein